MAGPSADVRLNVAASSAAAQLEMMTRKFKKMGKQAGQAAGDVNSKGKKTASTFNSWSANLGKSTVAALGVGTAVTTVLSASRLVTAELENQVQLSNQIKQKQQPYQENLRMFHLENVPMTVKDRLAFTTEVDQMLTSAGVQDKNAGLEIVRTVMSSMGNAAVPDRVAAAEEYVKLNRHLINNQQLESAKLMAATNAASQLVYQKDGSTMAAQSGLTFQALTSSMVANKQAFVSNIAPVSNKFNTHGLNQIESYALGAALSNRLNDVNGSLVDTVGANILGKLRMAEERFGFDGSGKSIRERQLQITAPDDPQAKQARAWLLGVFSNDPKTISYEQLSTLSDAEKNKRLMPHLGGKAKTLYPAMEFFQPQGTADGEGTLNDLFRSAFSDMGAVMESKNRVNVQATYAKLADSYRKEVQSTYDSDLFSVANQGQSHAQGLESIIQSRSRAQSLYSELTTPGSDLDEILKQSGVWSNTRVVQRTANWASDPGNYEHQLKQKEFVLRDALVKQFNVSPEGFEFRKGEFDVQSATPQELSGPQVEAGNVLIELLRQTVTELEGIRRDGANPQPVKPQKPVAAGIGK